MFIALYQNCCPYSVMFVFNDLESRLYNHLSFPTSCNTQDPVLLSSCSCVKTNFRNVLIHGIQEPSTLCNVFYIPSSRLLTRRWQESVNIHHTRRSSLRLKMKWPQGSWKCTQWPHSKKFRNNLWQCDLWPKTIRYVSGANDREDVKM